MKTIEQMLAQKPEPVYGNKWEIYDPAVHDKWAWLSKVTSAHEKAEWIAVLEDCKEMVKAHGYLNPTIMHYNRGLFLAVDEDKDFYDHREAGRVSLFDVVQHSGVSNGCGGGNTVNIMTYSWFTDPSGGLDVLHGYRGWTKTPCPSCFPVSYARAVAAGEKPYPRWDPRLIRKCRNAETASAVQEG